MARLVIVAGPALLPFHHPPSICSPTRPGLSLWQVPPFDQLPQFTSIPSLYPTISHSHIRGRLVIVAGPASSVSPHFFLSITPIFLFIWLPFPQAHDTACYCCKSHPSTCFPPHPPSSYLFPPYPSFGPACHCGRSRQIPLLTLPAALPFWIPIFNTLSLLWPGLSLWQVPPPPSPLLTTSPPYITPIYHSLLKARLVIVAGLA